MESFYPVYNAITTRAEVLARHISKAHELWLSMLGEQWRLHSSTIDDGTFTTVCMDRKDGSYLPQSKRLSVADGIDSFIRTTALLKY
jgi:hypothetical protein